MAVIVALIVGIGGGDDSGSRRTTLPDLPKSKQQGSNGIVLSVPPSWERVKNDGVIRLRSPLGDVQVLISSPAPAGQATAALKAELKAIANNYQVIDVGRPTTKEIGGLKGKQVVLTARQPNGKEVRILVITANGDQRAYVAEVVAAGDASEHNLAQGQQIINSLKLTG